MAVPLKFIINFPFDFMNFNRFATSAFFVTNVKSLTTTNFPLTACLSKKKNFPKPSLVSRDENRGAKCVMFRDENQFIIVRQRSTRYAISLKIFFFSFRHKKTFLQKGFCISLKLERISQNLSR